MILRHHEDIFHLMKGNPGVLEGQHPAQIISRARYKSSLQSSGAVHSQMTSLGGSLNSSFVTRHPASRQASKTCCLPEMLLAKAIKGSG